MNFLLHCLQFLNSTKSYYPAQYNASDQSVVGCTPNGLSTKTSDSNMTYVPIATSDSTTTNKHESATTSMQTKTLDANVTGESTEHTNNGVHIITEPVASNKATSDGNSVPTIPPASTALTTIH